MSDSSFKTLESESTETQKPTPNSEPSYQDPSAETSDQSKNVPNIEEQDGIEEEEQGECGFCVYMKGGGCRETFTAWEKCIQDSEKNNDSIVEKCFEVTALLKKCMEVHSEYYEPVLRAEKDAEEVAEKELEKENQEGLKDSVDIEVSNVLEQNIGSVGLEQKEVTSGKSKS